MFDLASPAPTTLSPPIGAPLDRRGVVTALDISLLEGPRTAGPQGDLWRARKTAQGVA
jgi:hypothetical protein